MKLITAEQCALMLENGRKSSTGKTIDLVPVVKLFTPDANATWLFTELDPADEDIAFGLCDLGIGFPELGYASLTEISEIRGRLNLPVERDLHFKPTKPLSSYAETARCAERIVA